MSHSHASSSSVGSKVKREDSDDEEEQTPIASSSSKAESKGVKQAVVSTCVLVTNTDYANTSQRASLKALGGIWCASLSGWILPEGLRASAEAIARGEEVSTLAIEAAKSMSAAPEVSDPPASENADAKITVSAYKKSILVHGETQKVKDVLKALQGSWNRVLLGWVFQEKKKEQILRVLRKDPTNVVVEGPAPDNKQSKKAKSADDDFIAADSD